MTETNPVTSTWEQRREAEQQAEQEWFEQISALIGQIGLALGWALKTYNQDEYRHRLPDLEDANGHRLCFGKSRDSAAQAAKKLHIAGGWPSIKTATGSKQVTAYDVSEKSPSIEVSLSRGANVIAREITRRLLPEYSRIYGRCVERINATLSYEAKTKIAYNSLCASLGLAPENRSYDGTISVRLYEYLDGMYGELRPSGDSIDMDVRGVPLAVAIQVCAILRIAKEAQGDDRA